MASDIIIGVPLLIETILILTGREATLQRILTVVSGEEQHGLIVEWGYLEEELASVVGLLHTAGAHSILSTSASMSTSCLMER